MQFMVTLKLDPAKAKGPPPNQLAEAEFEAVRGLYMAGVLRQIWVHADRSGAVVVAEGESSEEVAKAFSALPLVREGVMQQPVVVALAPYFGFAPRA